jgi:hypothetical protein
VFINNQMACRQGDIVVEKPGLALGPMNPILMGCPTVLIGEAGSATPALSVPAVMPAALAGIPQAQAIVAAAALTQAAAEGTALVEICPG